MAIYEKFDMPFHSRFRDVRSVGQRLAESLGTPSTIANIFFGLALALIFLPLSGARFILAWIDVAAVIAAAYMCWFNLQPIKLPFKMPAYAHMKDPKNPIPGKDGVAGAS
jgi:hypothetical protein